MNPETQNSIVQTGAIAPLEKFTLTKEFETWLEDTLAAAALIGRVENEVEDSNATKAASELKGITNALEKARVQVTAPALKFQRDAKAFFDSKGEEARAEFSRLLKLSGDYTALIQARRRAEENAKREELLRVEREREAALAEAKTHEQRDQIQEHYNQVAAVEQAAVPTVEPMPIPKGKQVGGDLEITIVDIWALAKAYPNCVRPPEIRLTETKALIRAGVKPPGITWQEVTKVGIRASGQRTVEV